MTTLEDLYYGNTTPAPTRRGKFKEETKPIKITKPSAAKNAESKAEEPQEEIYVGIQWPEFDPVDIERLVIEKVNAYRIAQGDTVATMLPGLTEVARYRANDLTTSFEHCGMPKKERNVKSSLQR